MSGRLLRLVCTAAMAAGTVLAPLPAVAEPAPAGGGVPAGSVTEVPDGTSAVTPGGTAAVAPDSTPGTPAGTTTGTTADSAPGSTAATAPGGTPGDAPLGTPSDRFANMPTAPGSSAATAPGGSAVSLTRLLTDLQALYRQAETATEDYNAAEEKLRAQQAEVARLDRQLARSRLSLQDSRAAAGRLARQQYQGASAGLSPYLRLVMSADPQHALDEGRMIGRLAGDRAATVRRLSGAERRTDRLARAARKALDEQLTLAERQRQARDHVRARLGQVEMLLASLGPERFAALTALENTRETDRQSTFLASGALDEGGADGGVPDSGVPGDAVRGSSAPGSSRNPTPAGDLAVRTAVAQLGKPYRWGAEGPDSYDCSGLTSDAWARAGRPIPRTSQEQWARLPHVPLNRLRPGDLVVYFPEATHVGMYIGDGKVVHAPHPGARVKVSPIAANPVLGAVRPDAAGQPLAWYSPPRLPVGAGTGPDTGYDATADYAAPAPAPATEAR